MFAPSNESQQSITPEKVDAWLQANENKRLVLHVLAAEPSTTRQRYEAFMEMSTLLQEAFEEVRVISASLRERSQRVRAEAVDLQGYTPQLLGHCTKSMAHMAQFLPPPPQEVQQAESQMLEIFKHGPRQGKQ